MSALFNGFFEGLGQNFHIDGSLLFGDLVGGDVETHLHRQKVENQTHE